MFSGDYGPKRYNPAFLDVGIDVAGKLEFPKPPDWVSVSIDFAQYDFFIFNSACTEVCGKAFVGPFWDLQPSEFGI